MAAQENAGTVTSAVKAAFESLTEQLKKHKQMLRSHHGWPHRRVPDEEEKAVKTVPFEKTFAAIRSDTISPADVSGYINVNLPRLQRYVERQLSYRESQGQLAAEQVKAEDVIGEAISDALDEQHDPPERMKLEPWLYRLANQAIDRLSSPNSEGTWVPLEGPRGTQNVLGTDEAFLQFHQPDERMMEEAAIPDLAANNPEELAARRELISLVEATLRDGGADEREAFILYTIEGFTAEEIADITGHHVEEVRALIRQGREHLQRALPMKDSLKEKLVEYSRSA
jgi:RNA polymerase sigma factor (sigma-70 family)